MKLWALALLSGAMRLAMLAYGEWQDENGPLKYTDVDYVVVSDAARHVLAGSSPYERTTYRYTPILAWLCVPNHLLLPSFGKLLFVCGDMVVGFLLHAIMTKHQRLAPNDATRLLALFWLCPFTIGVSTRGSHDSLTCVLVLLAILAALDKRHARAGFALGMAVHMKLYPVIYGLPLLLFAARNGGASSAFVFSATAALTAAAVCAGCWLAYGDQFVRDTYLYHFTRVDFKHNFSVWFYPLYTSLGAHSALARLASALQLLVTAAVGVMFAGDLPFCCALQTLLFVCFNRVVTAQYFVWYMSLLPLALARSSLPVPAAALWIVAELHWLAWAGMLELLGYPVFLPVWAASLVFFLAHCVVVYFLLRSYPNSRAPVTKCD